MKATQHSTAMGHQRVIGALLVFILTGLIASTSRVEAGNLGHRMGGDVYKPENTLHCYKQALAKLQDDPDFKYVELDVQESKDGKLVVFHDVNNIKRLVPDSSHNRRVLGEAVRQIGFEKIRICDLTVAQIKNLKLANNASIPSLHEVLEASVRWGLRKPIFIEIKSLSSDQCRSDLLATVAPFRKSLDVNFLAYHGNFNRSFPDPLRWKPKFKTMGLRVYTAEEPKTAEFDIVKDAVSGAENWKFTTVLEETIFSVNADKERTRSFPINLPSDVCRDCALRVGIYHGRDDTGDNGLNFKLVNESGEELIADFTKAKGWQWFETALATQARLILVLNDHDTIFDGKYPGNGGAVKAALVHRTPAVTLSGKGGAPQSDDAFARARR